MEWICLVFLLAVINAVATSVDPNLLNNDFPTPLYAFESFLSLNIREEHDIVHIEFRQRCCESLETATQVFCSDFSIGGDDCLHVLEYLTTTSSSSTVICECSQTHAKQIQKLGTLSVNVHHQKTLQRLQLAVYEQDLKTVDPRIDRLCVRFRLDAIACGNVRVFVTHKILELEKKQLYSRIMNHMKEDEGREMWTSITSVIDALVTQKERLEKQLKDKVDVYVSLHWQARAKQHELERRIRVLEQQHPQEMRLEIDVGIDTTCHPLQAEHTHTFAHGTMRIPRFSVQTLSYNQYLQLARTSTPFIITGMGSLPHRPGLPAWTIERLIQTCGDVIVPLKQRSSVSMASNTWAGIKSVKDMPLREFLMNRSNFYLHDWSLPTHCPRLLSDFYFPRYFTNDYLQSLSSVTLQRDYWPSLFIGDDTTSSGLHTDWGSTAAWMGVLQGRKHWRIGKPSLRAALEEQVPTIDAPTEGRFRRALHDEGAVRPDEVYEDMVVAGEVLFIPTDCPHEVQNMEPTIAVAANFVDDANVQDFIRFLQRQQHLSYGEEYRHYQLMLDTIQTRTIPINVTDLSYTKFKAQVPVH